MAAVQKATVSAVHKITFFAVRIELTKAVTSSRVNIKPTKPTTSTSRAHQVYKVSRNLQKHYDSSDCLVATIIELLKLPLQR